MAGEGKSPAKASAALLPLWPRAYLPMLLWSTGQGAMYSVLALAAKSIGASTSIAATVVAMAGIGTVIFDLPSGRIIARIGELWSSMIATFVISAGLILSYLAKTPLVLGIGVFFVACGWGLWNLRILTHLSRVAPPAIRGRALALIGGVSRTGNVVGPFILALVIGTGRHANERDSFLIFLVGAVLGFILYIAARDRSDHAAHQTSAERIKVFRKIASDPRAFLTAATGTYSISLLRGSRQALLPLWGAHIGLSAGSIVLIFGISSILDVTFFYPSGIISDRFGRKVVAVPCMVLLSLGHLLMPFTHTFSSLFVVSLLLGFGNSLGSGIVMTLGADRAPDVGRASFLAVWRLVGDSGTASGPLIGAAIVALASLVSASRVIGILGLIGTAVVVIYMDEPGIDRQRAVPVDV